VRVAQYSCACISVVKGLEFNGTYRWMFAAWEVRKSKSLGRSGRHPEHASAQLSSIPKFLVWPGLSPLPYSSIYLQSALVSVE
jgi:hypothetical protein